MGLSDIDEDDGPIVPPPPPRSVPATANTTHPVIAPGPSTTAAPPTSGAKTTGVDLDDLFGDMNLASAHPPPSKSAAAVSASAPPRTAAATRKQDDFLDSLFTGISSSPTNKSGPTGSAATPTVGLHVGSPSTPDEDDLFDFKGTKKEKFNDAETLLSMFENRGKGGGRFAAKDSLENLTQNKDDNKVRARLLALMDYYDVLGVAQTASEEDIRRSYKKKALELHPDRVGREQTTEEAELFKMITKANEVLTDPELRKKYDDELRSKQSVAGAPANGNNWFEHLKTQP